MNNTTALMAVIKIIAKSMAVANGHVKEYTDGSRNEGGFKTTYDGYNIKAAALIRRLEDHGYRIIPADQ